MSLKSFLNSIGHFFEKIFKGLKKPAKLAIHWGVLITENIKNFVDSEAADVLTSIIPGTLDDKIKEKLRTAIPEILVKLKLADECADETDPQKLTACAIKVLQAIEKPFRNDFLDALAVQIGIVAADGKLTWDEAKSVLKWYYDHKFSQQSTEGTPAIVTDDEEDN